MPVNFSSPAPPPVITERIYIVEDEVEVEDEIVFEMDIEEVIEIVEDEHSEPEIFYIVEQMPEFPGGELALRKFIQKNLIRPEGDNEVQGKVYIRFVVTNKGNVKDGKVLRGIDDITDKAAMDVINKLPNFKPGMQRGKTVNVYYTVPIRFTLD